jgi:PAS domain S-box-containing protein
MTTLDAAALRLAALVASSEDAILSEDLNGTIETWNGAAERMFGYEASEIIGLPIWLLVPESLREEERQFRARALAGESVSHTETVRLTRAGTLLQVALSVSPIRVGDGDIVGVSRIIRDITARKVYEREAFRLAAIVNSSQDAIVSKSLDGTILTWNRGAERIFGYTAAEAVGRSIRMIIPADRMSEEDDVLARVRAGEGVNAYETIRQRKDGARIDISLTVSPILDDRGVVIGASKIARDITAQLLLRRELEEASRVKDEFLATLSHELRTPLNALMGYVHMLKAGNLPKERRRQAVEIIDRNAHILSQLVSDVLDVSNMVTGRLRLQMAEHDVADIVRAAIEVVRPALDAKRLVLSVDEGQTILLVRGDADRLRQVFWNLLMNAVKFTPERGRVDVRLSRQASLAQVTVADTGIGIKAVFLPHLFERFQQADSGIRGLGLGLALVRHFVELHGGQVTGSSPGEGQGAIFTVTLPLARPD